MTKVELITTIIRGLDPGYIECVDVIEFINGIKNEKFKHQKRGFHGRNDTNRRNDRLKRSRAILGSREEKPPRLRIGGKIYKLSRRTGQRIKASKKN